MMDEDHLIGKQIGNYQIVAMLNSGAFGSVFQAQHTILSERIVAIKLLHAYLGSAREREQFLQEARFLEKLKHRYILSILDVGFSDGFPYLIAEYASQGSLRDRLKRQYPRLLPTEEVINILSQIGQALQHAHQQNIIHRDLKPDNILFNAYQEALLADFGIATMLSTASVKHVTVITGTPPYMAPEQFQGTICKESDQYALGCIAYQLFTGQPPFSAPDFVSMGFKHITEQPAAPTQLNPGLRGYVADAILKAMAKQRTDRFSSVAEFIAALRGPASLDAEIPTVLASRPLTHMPTPVLSEAQSSEMASIATGKAMHAVNRYKEALAAFEQALGFNARSCIAFIGKGKALCRLNRFDEALDAFAQAIQLEPQRIEAICGKGDALAKLNRYQEALETFEQARQLDPTCADALRGNGDALEDLSREEEAKVIHQETLAAYERILQGAPNDAPAYYGKGV